MNAPTHTLDCRDFSGDFGLDAANSISVLTLLADQFAGESDVNYDDETITNVMRHIRDDIIDLVKSVTDFQAKNGHIWPDLATDVSRVEEVSNRAKEVFCVLLTAYENVYRTAEKVCLDNKTIYAALDSINLHISNMVDIVEEFEKECKL